MNDHLYIMDDNQNPVLATLDTWGDRGVACDEIGGVMISTVFLGIDHNFRFKGLPLLYETMIFGGKHDEYQARSVTKYAALSKHDEAVAMVRDSQRGWLQKLWNWMKGN